MRRGAGRVRSRRVDRRPATPLLAPGDIIDMSIMNRDVPGTAPSAAPSAASPRMDAGNPAGTWNRSGLFRRIRSGSLPVDAAPGGDRPVACHAHRVPAISIDVAGLARPLHPPRPKPCAKRPSPVLPLRSAGGRRSRSRDADGLPGTDPAKPGGAPIPTRQAAVDSLHSESVIFLAPLSRPTH